MNYVCQITDEKDQHFLKIKKRTPAQEIPIVLGTCYGEILTYMHEVNLKMSGAPFVIYYNMDMNDLEIDICIPLAVESKGRGHIQSDKMDKGQYISTLHIGPYQTLNNAYRSVTEYIQTNNIAITGIAYEFYLNDPQEVAPEDLQTRIMFKLL